MSDHDCCRACGEKRPADAPSGLCPTCLLKAGLAAPDSEMDNVTLLFGPASSSVLQAFGDAFGKIPPVLLRDADSTTESDPIVRPSSDEIPDAAQRSARLQIFGEIARGGMGAVLKGRDADLGRDLAVKILLESHRDKPDMIRRFIEEAQIAGQLQHPGIVPVYELGAFGDRRPYFAMKLVKGHTLAEILTKRTSLSEGLPRLLSIFESICQTMAYAHARGVIHRDLKPSNVIVGSFGEVQVMDWGLAKVLPQGGVVDDASAGHAKDQGTIIATARNGSDSDLSQAGSIMGTPAYMSPEQARGEIDQIDERADVFALGSILCELLTGHAAFVGRNGGEIQRKAARGDLADATARLDQSNLGHDPELIALAKSCLSSERDNRPRHAGEVAERIGSYHSGVRERLRQSEIERAAEKARAEEATKRIAVERQRFRLTMALAASVVASMLMGGGGWAYIAQQQALRQAATERVVTVAIDKATLLRGQAKAAPIEDLSKWSEALAAANEARSSIETGEPSSTTRERVDELLATLKRELTHAVRRAEELAKDKKLFERLDAIRFQFADNDIGYWGLHNWNLKPTDKAYATAFRDFGIDIDRMSPTEAARHLRQRSDPQEFASRIDEWALIRKESGETFYVGEPDESWERLVSIAEHTDDDSWRNSVRSLIGKMDYAAVRRFVEDESELDRQPPMSLKLLVAVLQEFNPNSSLDNESTEILKRAWRLAPNDYEICRKISRKSDRKLDKIRFLTAAAAAAPENPVPHEEIANALMPRNDVRLLGNYDLVRANENVVPQTSTRLAFKQKNGDTWLVGPTRFLEPTVDDVENRLEAVAELEWAVRLDPASSVRHCNLAQALVRQFRFEDALKECQAVAAIDAEFNLGKAIGRNLYGMGQLDQAAELIRTDIAKNPNGDHDYPLLGIIYYEQGRKEEALAEFRKELSSINYDERYWGGDVRKLVEIAIKSIGDSDEIEAAYAKKIEAHPDDPEMLANKREFDDFNSRLMLYRNRKPNHLR